MSESFNEILRFEKMLMEANEIVMLFNPSDSTRFESERTERLTLPL